ncbi:unnamed protein product [Heligmosomoides polygyrus]|uniref:Reverse transcriptase n=1 Tax=Heligmosomoides polygyrus TaxID=6339 RepID=A0A183G8L2_HELPZ|nr:unnamed protein product [Heligmosomoides polygyrus]
MARAPTHYGLQEPGISSRVDGKLMVEVNSRVSAAWSKWRSLTGVLCNRKIPEHLKSKIYRAVVLPVAMYGAECWPATKEFEARLSVMEMKMLRWTAVVTLMKRRIEKGGFTTPEERTPLRSGADAEEEEEHYWTLY